MNKIIKEKIIEGTNYLVFPKTYFAGGIITGSVNGWGIMICTKKYIFFVPLQDTTSFGIAVRLRSYKHFLEDDSFEEGLKKLLSDPQIIVEQLEDILQQALADKEELCVFPLAELESIKIWGGFLGQARLKKKGQSVKVFTPKGLGNKKKLKAFYAK